ncbi:MAG TPA: hypothetical protein DHV36_06850 [Desulfobacteraceae bacterium]|nr:hypothetical protein [Desulfobacteraceae bacterium]|tara:strand:+ start:1276 stop:1461 length:186 start_codon:yes stop_codon:yes gene_type:complete
MRFSDFFVPKYLHSNPKVRIKFVNSASDLKILESIIENDQDNEVVRAARERLQALTVSTAT